MSPLIVNMEEIQGRGGIQGVLGARTLVFRTPKLHEEGQNVVCICTAFS